MSSGPAPGRRATSVASSAGGGFSVGDVGKERRVGYGSHRGVQGSTVLRPTRAGSYARRLWPRVVTRVEERWQACFGTELVGCLRDALVPLAGKMPWSPPEVNPSDGFYTHIFDGPAAADDAEDTPLVALLGQALTAWTFEHEKDAEVSLPIAADLLRVIDGRVLRMRDLPLLSGISKEAVAMAVNYLLRNNLSEPLARALDRSDCHRPRCARRLPGEGRSLEERGPPTSARRGRGKSGGSCRWVRSPGRVLAGRIALPGADPAPSRRPPGRTALAPDGAASWRMA